MTDAEDPDGSPAPPLVRARELVWQGEAPTEPVPLADTLAHTPYREPESMSPPEEEDEAYAALDLAVRAGELMLRCGAGTRDVESSVVAVAAASGLDNLELDVTLQSLLIQWVSPSGEPVTVLRVVRSSSRDFARLVEVHGFVEELVAGQIGRAHAAERLQAIAAERRFWPRWFVSLAYGVVAGSVTMLLGGGPEAIGLSAFSALLIDQAGRLLAGWGLPAFYISATGAALATAFASAALALGHAGVLSLSTADFALLVAGGIVVLLPSRAMTSAVEDAITGYPVTGAGRMFGVGLTMAGIIAGVAGGVALSLRMDHLLGLGLAARATAAVAAAGGGATLGVRVAAAAVGSAASALSMRTRRELILATAVLGAAGMVATGLTQAAGLGALTGLALACWVVGFGGRLLALKLGAPTLVLVVPALAPQLPGLAIFRGMYQVVTGAVGGHAAGAVSPGVSTLLGAGAAALAIATGAVLGEVMAARFDRSIVLERRARRR